MSGPGDQRADTQHPGQLRASHADREQAIEQLKAAFVDGRLSKDEFDLRVGQTLASRTYADLTAVTSDLHARPAAARLAVGPVAARPPSSPIRTLAKAARRSGVCLLVAFVIVGVLAMTTNGDGGPSAFLAFCSVVIAVIAASGFLGYGVVDAWQEHRSRAQLPPRPRRNALPSNSNRWSTWSSLWEKRLKE